MHGGTPHIPPVLNFSTLTKSFTGALPRKANTSQLGFIVFQGEMMGSGKGGGGGVTVLQSRTLCVQESINHFLCIEFSA